jgi:hypothetical protein
MHVITKVNAPQLNFEKILLADKDMPKLALTGQ